MEKIRFRLLNKFLALLLVGVGLTVEIAACTASTSTISSPASTGAVANTKPVELTLVLFAGIS